MIQSMQYGAPQQLIHHGADQIPHGQDRSDESESESDANPSIFFKFIEFKELRRERRGWGWRKVRPVIPKVVLTLLKVTIFAEGKETDASQGL